MKSRANVFGVWQRYQARHDRLRLLPWTHFQKSRVIVYLWSFLFIMAITTWQSRIAYQRIVDFQQWEKRSQHVSTEIERPAEPVHLYIPWRVDADVQEGGWFENRWLIHDDSLTFVSDSGRPTEDRPLVIYGHNTRSLLGNIRVLTGDENITLTTSNGEQHSYSIEKIQEIDPSEGAFLQSVRGDRLILYTCSGPWDSKRFVVIARRMVTS